MAEKDFSTLTDSELLAEAKRMKTRPITHATLIGFMVGVIVYSVAKNTLGLFSLIPLFIIYKLINSPGNDEALKEELAKRNLT